MPSIFCAPERCTAPTPHLLGDLLLYVKGGEDSDRLCALRRWRPLAIAAAPACVPLPLPSRPGEQLISVLRLSPRSSADTPAAQPSVKSSPPTATASRHRRGQRSPATDPVPPICSHRHAALPLKSRAKAHSWPSCAAATKWASSTVWPWISRCSRIALYAFLSPKTGRRR